METRNISLETEGEILVQITGAASGDSTMFEPRSFVMTKNSSTENSVTVKPLSRAPEKKLTVFALRLAVLEKAATGLGTLGFIWATVVLLGEFAIALSKTDFWFITIILLIEGARIFSRSHELELQHHQANVAMIDDIRKTKSIRRRDSGEGSLRRSRTWMKTEVPLFPSLKWIFMSRNMGKILHWLQMASAMACLILSSLKLIRQDYGKMTEEGPDKRNQNSALNIFYSLALAEALLFLLERAYWEFEMFFRKVLEQVARESELGPDCSIVVERFFYEAYSKCINGSIFDGLKMDMVSFGTELLGSNFPDEQLSGARILRRFSTSQRFSDDTLQKIGTNIDVIERLLEILNWKTVDDEEIRLSAAEILSKLAGKKQNALRVAGIPGAMESISSLLQSGRSGHGACDEISEKRMMIDDIGDYGVLKFNHLGLIILKKLARDHDNCGKIGNTRGLLPKIIDFTQASERLLREESASHAQILIVKRSLQVVKMLGRTTGTTGKELRREISEVVFTISNIRDILRYGERHTTLQWLGIEILKSLALEEDATERIGGTGGILTELFALFFERDLADDQKHVKTAAGEALAMLAMGSERNCQRILRLNVIEKLVEALQDPVLRINAARILRNLCVYSGANRFDHLGSLTAAGPTIIRAIMSEEHKMQEVMLGLAAHVFKFVTTEESTTMFETARVQESELARELIQILGKHHYPSIKVPRIRRFAVELALWMMRNRRTNIEVLKNLGLEHQLQCITETTSEIESFNVFSGTVGMNRHNITIHCLVETALNLLRDCHS